MDSLAVMRAIKAHVEKLGCWTWKEGYIYNNDTGYYIGLDGYSHIMQLRHTERGPTTYTEWRFNDCTKTEKPEYHIVPFKSREQMLLDIYETIDSINK